jgi:hypothetical protein
VHCSLEQQLGPALEGEARGKPLGTALEKIAADPHGAGRVLQGLKVPSRVGQVRRVWVKGRTGYRLIYYVPQVAEDVGFQPVIPLFLSEETRGSFDWDNIDPNEVGHDIVADFCAKRYERFRSFTLQ